MAELPASWNLKVRKQKGTGRAEVIQKGKDGNEYRALLCDGPEVTAADVKRIADHDGEQVTSRDIAMRAVAEREAYWQRMGDQAEADFAEPAEQIAMAGLHTYQRTVGYSKKYALNYDNWLRSIERPN